MITMMAPLKASLVLQIHAIGLINVYWHKMLVTADSTAQTCPAIQDCLPLAPGTTRDDLMEGPYPSIKRVCLFQISPQP